MASILALHCLLTKFKLCCKVQTLSYRPYYTKVLCQIRSRGLPTTIKMMWWLVTSYCVKGPAVQELWLHDIWLLSVTLAEFNKYDYEIFDLWTKIRSQQWVLWKFHSRLLEASDIRIYHDVMMKRPNLKQSLQSFWFSAFFDIWPYTTHLVTGLWSPVYQIIFMW